MTVTDAIAHRQAEAVSWRNMTPADLETMTDAELLRMPPEVACDPGTGEVSAAELARREAAGRRWAETCRKLAAGIPLVEPGPVRPAQPVVAIELTDPDIEATRRHVARIRAAREAGRPAPRLPRSMRVSAPLPEILVVWWPYLPAPTRLGCRVPLNASRRTVVAAWPPADRFRYRAAAVALWALWAVLAGVVAVAVVVVLVVVSEALRGAVRAVRWCWARRRARKHRQAWEAYYAAQGAAYGTPVPVQRSGVRRRLTTAGVVAVVMGSGLAYLLFMTMVVVVAAGKGAEAERRAQATTTVVAP